MLNLRNREGRPSSRQLPRVAAAFGNRQEPAIGSTQDATVLRPSGARRSKVVRAFSPMASRSGRLERRTRLEVPVQIAVVQEPSAPESATTQNTSPHGLRILTQKTLEPNQRVVVTSLTSNLRVHGRVVYCERLGEGSYGIGLRFQDGDSFRLRGAL